MPQNVTVESTALAAMLGLIGVVLFYGLRPAEERRALLGLALGSFLLKAALVPLYYWMLVEQGYDGFAYVDARAFDLVAREMAQEIAQRWDHFSAGWSYEDPGYNYIGAASYLLFGANTLVVRMWNAVISTFTLLYVYRLGRLAFDEKVAKRAALLTAFLPFAIIITINHRKEPFTQFFALFLSYHALCILQRRPGWHRNLAMLPIGFVPMVLFRHAFVLPFLGVALLSYFVAQPSMVRRIAATVLTLVTVLALQFGSPEDSALRIGHNVEKLQGRFETSAAQTEVGGLVRFARMGSITQIYKLPVLGALVVILPYPPRVDFTYLPSTLLSWANFVFLLLLPQFLVGVRECVRPGKWRQRGFLLILVAVFLLLIGAVNVGLMRYKETIFPVALLLTAAGTTVRQNLFWIGGVYFGLALLASTVYLSWIV